MKENEKFAEFGKEVWEWFLEGYKDEVFYFEQESETVMEMAAKYGLVKRVKYDPKIHGEYMVSIGVDEGDEIWWWGK